MQRIYLLKGKLQSYSWGGFHYIPDLLSFSNQENKPYAEYWMGAHPSHSSTISDGTLSLADFIKSQGEKVLGSTVYHAFKSLPYLFKILDVRQMLSIQVHPSKEEAIIGFEREEAAAIPITAPHRNYKDRNHKPELMVALSDFWLLHGFKPEADISKILTAIPQLNFLSPHFDKGGYKTLFSFVMQMEQGEVDTVIDSLARQVMPLYKQNKIDKHKEDFWAARAIDTFCSEPPYDRGIFCIYLFNLLHLKKGQGIYQPAGMPHAYLEGQNVEIMANSDNVLRAGLTGKHIDVSELLKHTVCTPTIPDVLHYTGGSEITYPSPAKEFALQQYHLKGEEKKLYTESAEILFVIEGNVKIATEAESLSIQKGESVFIMADTDIILQCDASAVVFRASVGAV